MTRIEDIKTDNWTLSLVNAGDVVMDADDINQCILTILRTQKGTDPVNPLFGIDLLKWIDKPVNELIPGIIAEIVSQVSIFETRALVKQVTYELDESNVKFKISWIAAGGLTGQTLYNYGR